MAELRGILGVPKGKLTTWSNLRLRAIEPAVREVNQLSLYMVEVNPVKTGRSVTHVELKWWKKDQTGQGAVARELNSSKVGRKTRLEERDAAQGLAQEITQGCAQEVKPRPAWLDRQGEALAAETYQTAKLRHPGYDVYAVESEWRSWAAGKSPARDPDKAFLAFFQKFAAVNPL